MTCVEGNFGVGSSRDNEASAPTGGPLTREPWRRLPAARWLGARSAGHRVNSGEVPIKTVKFVEPKLLSGSGQKARGQVRGLNVPPTQTPHHRSRGTTLPLSIQVRNIRTPSSPDAADAVSESTP